VAGTVAAALWTGGRPSRVFCVDERARLDDTTPVRQRRGTGLLGSVLIWFLIFLAFSECLAGRQVLSSRSRLWQRKDWRGAIFSQVKTKTAGWGVASISQTEGPYRIGSEFVAIGKHSQYKASRNIGGQFRKVFLGDRPKGRYEYRIARDYAAFTLLSDGPRFYISGPSGHSFERMGVVNSRGFLFTTCF
jgi:hypothetical protein